MFNTGGHRPMFNFDVEHRPTSADVEHRKYSMANHQLDIARWWPMFTMNIHTAPNFGVGLNH